MQRLKRLLTLGVLALALGGCTVFSSVLYSPDGLGIASQDGVGIKFTLTAPYSQLLSNIYTGCGAYNINCFDAIVVPNINASDTVGRGAMIDCTNVAGYNVCGYDLWKAVVGRIFTGPNQEAWTSRCLGFNVGYSLFPPSYFFLPQTWNWYRPGSWYC